MKTFLLSIMLLLAGSFSLNAQSLKVSYLTKFDTASPNFLAGMGVNDQVKTVYANALKDLTMKFALNCDEKQSLFRFESIDENQKISIMGQSVSPSAMAAEYKNNCDFIDFEKKEVIHKAVFMGKQYLICEPFAPDTFIIQPNEKKEIIGFECQKAISADNSQIVWFTPHIPMQAGPIVVSNIKGLILEARAGGLIFTAEAIDENQTEEIIAPSTGVRVTREEYMKTVSKTIEMMQSNATGY